MGRDSLGKNSQDLSGNKAKGTFTVFQATSEGKLAFITIDVGLNWRKGRKRFPWLLRIELPILKPDNQGLCSREESNQLDDLEDLLLQVLAPSDYCYIGHITWNGKRYVLIYVADPDRIIELLKNQAGRSNERAITVVKELDTHWKEYRQFLV